MRTALFLVALLAAGNVLAEPDTFSLGTGRSGSLRIDGPQSLVVNRYEVLTAAAAAGTRDVAVANPSTFSAGELVLLHQSSGLTPAPASGDQRRIDLDNLGAHAPGRFEYARVEAVQDSALRLTAPLQYGYAANVTQVVSVPEYTSLEVRSGATLRAAPWEGGKGGILAVLVSGRLRNDGVITVDGAGFRGGAFLNHADLNGCTGLDEPVASGGSYKGEGVVAGSLGTASGRGNLANGGGGGICHNAGGGGGSHAGAGGGGGRSAPVDSERDVGGLGGAPVAYVPYQRILFGGGGGAGEGNDDEGSSGGAGGGLMLLRAQEVRGSGVYRANGATPPATPGDDGAGGGGAGGAISLRATEELECGRVEAQGGAGGDVTEAGFALGPGGGGGGGVLFLQAESFECTTSVLAGAPGQSAATGDSHGAGPSSVDSGTSVGAEQTVQLPFRLPNTPTLMEPPDGATEVPRRALIKGVAGAGVLVHVFLDGVLYRQLVSGTDGVFSFTPSADLAPGAHQLTASAEALGVRSPVSAPNRFGVVTPADAGTPDAGTPDSGTPDSGTPDSGTPDAGTPDGGSTEPGTDGGTENPGGLVPPVVVVPEEGEVVGPRPLFAGTVVGTQRVGLVVDGIQVAEVAVDEEGRFRYTLTDAQALEPGAHSVIAQALGTTPANSQPTTFEVVTSPAGEVGCGCGASPGAGLGAVVLLLGAWAARRRRG